MCKARRRTALRNNRQNDRPNHVQYDQKTSKIKTVHEAHYVFTFQENYYFILTIFRMSLFGAAHKFSKRSAFLNSVTHIMQWWNVAQWYPHSVHWGIKPLSKTPPSSLPLSYWFKCCHCTVYLQYFLSCQITYGNILLHLLTRHPRTTSIFFLCCNR